MDLGIDLWPKACRRSSPKAERTASTPRRSRQGAEVARGAQHDDRRSCGGVARRSAARRLSGRSCARLPGASNGTRRGAVSRSRRIRPRKPRRGDGWFPWRPTRCMERGVGTVFWGTKRTAMSSSRAEWHLLSGTGSRSSTERRWTTRSNLWQT